VSVLPITNTDRRTTGYSTPGSLGDVSSVQKAASQLYRRNVPLLHTSPTSRYVTACDQYYQAFPKVASQVTNAGVTRPGYEATFYLLYHSFLKIYQAPPSRA